MRLIEPAMQYACQIQAYRQEFLESGDSMDGTSKLRRYGNTQDWIDYLHQQNHSPSGKAEDKPRAVQFIYVREQGQKVVGMIDLRFVLNKYLEKYGGHAGYSVAPGERNKGYATQMLKLVLPFFAERGIDQILVTCDKGNEGSRKTILHAGGIYESTVHEPDENLDVERYWLRTS